MKYHLRNLLRNNSFNKFTAIILGYQLWSILAINSSVTRKITVPLCFYGSHDTIIEQAPEEIKIVIHGKRSMLHNLDCENLSANINMDTLKSGKQTVQLTPEHLLLPNEITLKETLPSNITVTTKYNE